ncbi:hypothetical protein ACHAWF_000728 [Thalassiosira exigua]
MSFAPRRFPPNKKDPRSDRSIHDPRSLDRRTRPTNGNGKKTDLRSLISSRSHRSIRLSSISIGRPDDDDDDDRSHRKNRSGRVAPPPPFALRPPPRVASLPRSHVASPSPPLVHGSPPPSSHPVATRGDRRTGAARATDPPSTRRETGAPPPRLETKNEPSPSPRSRNAGPSRTRPPPPPPRREPTNRRTEPNRTDDHGIRQVVPLPGHGLHLGPHPRLPLQRRGQVPHHSASVRRDPQLFTGPPLQKLAPREAQVPQGAGEDLLPSGQSRDDEAVRGAEPRGDRRDQGVRRV